MRTIQEKLTTLNQYKTDIKTAIIEKGQTVEDDMSTYAEAILKISGGGPTPPPEPIIPGPEIPETDPLTFYKLDDGQGFIRLDKHGEFPDKVINYQINDNDWQVYSWDENGVGLEIHINKGDYLRFKGDSTNVSKTIRPYWWHQFYTYGGLYKCGGNIMSLVNYNTKISTYEGFLYLFRNTNIVTAPELPAVVVSQGCYQYMFQDCKNLLKAPKLPATTLQPSCYQYMFQNCTSLYYAPELPATTLQPSCYQYMFQNCTSLVNAPELPATTLAQFCYHSMFNNCVSLVNGPSIIPTINLQDCCCWYMFQNCYSLVNAPVLSQVQTAGDKSCAYMFQNCYSLVNAPELPATTIAQHCYEYMFNGCISLVNAPEIPATTLQQYCYNGMFGGCRSLVNAPSVLPATSLALYCYTNMFKDCTSLVNAPELPATTLAHHCYDGMFWGCTSLVNAPELPATTLAQFCYYDMFQDCYSLINAPELPAETLELQCYSYMFKNCTQIKELKCNIMYQTNGSIITDYISSSWLENVDNKKFYKNPSWVGPTTRDYNTIPSDWTIEDWIQ